ncbi:MAG: tetratricopeptide repeat protein [Gemmataceae bacterium]
MRTTRREAWGHGLVIVGVILAGFLGTARAEQNVSPSKTGGDDLRKLALSLNEVTGADPMRGVLQDLIANPTKTRKLVAQATKMTDETPQPFNRNATFLLALVAENLKDVDASARFYRLNAKQSLGLLSERSMAQAYVGLIQLYADNKRFADSEKVCKEFLALEGEEDDAVERLKPLVMRRMILAIAKQGSPDRALKMVDDLIKGDPRNWLHRGLKAQVLRESDRLDDAGKVYLDVIERIEKDTRLEKEEKQDYIDEYRYFLAGIFIDQGNVDKASEQLKILLGREPNNPTYNNDLGYIWADRGINLPEAEKMIRRAIEEERKLRKKLRIDGDQDNAAYLDSLGWVLHKQGRNKEALEALQAATRQKEGQHLEIFDHLAEVQFTLGEKQEALATWKKGLEFATTSKRDQKRKVEVEKKIKMLESK